VVFGGSAYLATAPIVGAPGADPSWALLVEKGDTGATGPAGANGVPGAPGPQGVKGDTGPQGLPGADGKPGTNGTNGSSVTVSDAPTSPCPNGGAAIADAFGHTEYVCDGKQGAQGPQGATGTIVVGAQTWVTSDSFTAPFVPCCSTSSVTSTANPLTLVPNSTFTANTGTGRLLIEATIPVTVSNGGRLVCQPNIDDKWAGYTLPNSVSATFDYVFQLNATGMQNVTLSRVYPAQGAGPHTFTLACGEQGGTFQLMTGGVVSFTVLELR